MDDKKGQKKSISKQYKIHRIKYKNMEKQITKYIKKC